MVILKFCILHLNGGTLEKQGVKDFFTPCLAMDRFKMQAAQEVGVNLQNGYNGHLTSREAGSVGGQMVKKMIEAYEQGLQ